MKEGEVSKATIARLPSYLRYLQTALSKGQPFVSSEMIAKSNLVSAVLVRKDLAKIVSATGTPRVGFETSRLIRDIEKFLGYDNLSDAILVGVGGLGKAFLGYEGFKVNGLNILAGFDIQPSIIGKSIGGKKVYPLSKLADFVREKNVNIAILSVPKSAAQSVTEILVQAGIKGIWNFAPESLVVPQDVVVKNEDLSSSLALLANQLANR